MIAEPSKRDRKEKGHVPSKINKTGWNFEIDTRSQPQTSRLLPAKSKNHTAQSNPAGKHARTQTPRVQPPRDFSKSLSPLLPSQPPLQPFPTIDEPWSRTRKNIFPRKNASTTDFYTSTPLVPCLPCSIFGNKSIPVEPWWTVGGGGDGGGGGGPRRVLNAAKSISIKEGGNILFPRTENWTTGRNKSRAVTKPFISFSLSLYPPLQCEFLDTIKAGADGKIACVDSTGMREFLFFFFYRVGG